MHNRATGKQGSFRHDFTKSQLEEIKSESKEKYDAFKTAEVLSKLLPVEIYVIDTTMDKWSNYKGTNGFYENGTVYVDINASTAVKNEEAFIVENTMLFTLSHELVHYIKDWSPEKFKVLSDFVLGEFADKGELKAVVNSKIEELKDISDYYKSLNAARLREAALEEVVAEACQRMLTDSDAIERLAELKRKDSGLFHKIKSFIANFFNRVVQRYKNLTPQGLEAKLVDKIPNMSERMKVLFSEALVAAAENQRIVGEKTGDGSKFQLAEVRTEFEKLDLPVKEYTAGNDTERTEALNSIEDIVGPVKFQKKWVPNMPKSDLERIRRVAKNEVAVTDNYIDSVTKWLYNEVGDKDYFALYSTEDTNDPTILYASLNEKAVYEYKFLTDCLIELEKQENDRKPKAFDEILSGLEYTPSGYVIYRGKSVEGRFGDRNVSVYSRTPGRRISRALLSCLQDSSTRRNSGRLNSVEASSQQVQTASATTEFQRKTLTELDREYMTAIENGNTEVARKLVDEATKQAFSESKLKDEKGNLLKVYHGTEAEDFSVFDKNRRGQTDSSMYGRGYYFAFDSDYSSDFGDNIRTFYLNIKNPYYIDINAPASVIADFLKSKGVEVDFDYSNMISHFFAKNFGSQRFTDALVKLGYDGVVVRTDEGENFETVAFHRNQMKLADAVTYDDNGNVIPLSERFDENKTDIRFQAKKVDKSNNAVDNVSRANKEGEIKNDYYPALTATEWSKFYKSIAEGGHLEKVHVGDVAVVTFDDKIIVAERVTLGKDAHDFQVREVAESYLLEKPAMQKRLKELIKNEERFVDIGRVYRKIMQLCQSYDDQAVLSIYDRSSARYVDFDAEGLESYDNGRIYRNGAKRDVGRDILHTNEPKVQRTEGDKVTKFQHKSVDALSDTELLARHLEENSEAVGEILRRTADIEMNPRVLNLLVNKKLKEYGISKEGREQVADMVPLLLDVAKLEKVKGGDITADLTDAIAEAIQNTDYTLNLHAEERAEVCLKILKH